MLTNQNKKEILLQCVKTGADFAELFIENTTDITIKVIGESVDDINTSKLHGASLRLLRGMEETFGYTNDVSYDGVMSLANKLNKFYNFAPVITDFDFNDEQTLNKTIINKASTEEPLSKKIKYCQMINEGSSSYDKTIVQSIANCMEHVQNIEVYNTNGVCKHDFRNVIRFAGIAIAQNENGKQTGSYNYGGNFGLDAYDNFDFKGLGIEAAKQAIVMLNASQVKGGVYDVVINNAFGGVIFHEACGHALEASSVARGLSVFANKLGEKVASDCVTAIDDGTIANEWGSANIDDEGHVTQKNVLIENGILKSYMVDYKNSRLMNTAQTGSGRRESYRYIPTSRMTNTYIANGKYEFEDLIKNTKYGIFAKSLGGGSVNPATGEFNFSINEGYMIEDGKITKPIRGATLIGKGTEVLMNIDMVANNQTFGYGICGASSGNIAACVGQPTIRVRNMTVGGNGGN